MTDLDASATEIAGMLSEDLRIVGLVAGSDAGDAAHAAVVETATELGRDRRILLANLREPGGGLDDFLDVVEEAGVWDVLAGRIRLGEVAVRVGERPFLYLPAGAGEEPGGGDLTGLADRVRQAEGTLLLYLEPPILGRDDLRSALDGIVTVGPVELDREALGLEVLGRLQPGARPAAGVGPVSGEEPEPDEIGLDELEAADFGTEGAGPEEPVSDDLAAAEEADTGSGEPSFEGPDEVVLQGPGEEGESAGGDLEDAERAGAEEASAEEAGDSLDQIIEDAFAESAPEEPEPEGAASPSDAGPESGGPDEPPSEEEPGGSGAEPPSDEVRPPEDEPEETPVGAEVGAADEEEGAGVAAAAEEAGGAGDGGWGRHRQRSGAPWGRIAAAAVVVLLLVGGWWWFAGRTTDGVGGDASGSPEAAAPAEAADTGTAGQAREAAAGEPETEAEPAAPGEAARSGSPPSEVPEALLKVLEGAPTCGYSVLVAGYGSWEAASSRARRWSEEDGRLYFVAPTSIRGGLYYRVFAGGTGSESEAKELIVSLVDEGRKERVAAWDARPVSRAFRLGVYRDRREAERAVRSHHDRRIPAYVLEASSGGETAYAVYAGAYTSSDAAEGLRAQLSEAGVSAPLVTRKGGPPAR